MNSHKELSELFMQIILKFIHFIKYKKQKRKKRKNNINFYLATKYDNKKISYCLFYCGKFNELNLGFYLFCTLHFMAV